MAPLLCLSLCSREDNWIEVFEVIFKDLAVPAVFVKLVLGSWFVLAVAMFYQADTQDQQARYVAVVDLKLHLLYPYIDTVLPATWLGSRTFCILVYMHQSTDRS